MSKYNPKNLLQQEPVAIGGGVTVLVQLLVLLHVVSLSAEQIAGITVAVVTLLTLLTRRKVTPSENVLVTKRDIKAAVDKLLKGEPK
jgi:uncharacterized membrane protein